MGRRRVIDKLTSEVRSQVRQFMLDSPHLTLDEATAELNREGIAISRSSVCRYRTGLAREATEAVAPGSLVVIVVDPQTAFHQLLTISAERTEFLSQLAALYPQARYS